LLFTGEQEKKVINETFSVYTGKKDIALYQNYATWQGNLTYFDHWGKENNNECNKVRGTDGNVFKPFVERGDRLDVFTNDVCRCDKKYSRNSTLLIPCRFAQHVNGFDYL
jgi:hypothetical protein